MSIIDHIQYLICRHDCVVVPGLGAFVAQYLPAKISSDGLMLMPPSRMLVFNNVISHDDGLLAGSVARCTGVSYETARADVENDVEILLNRIDAEGYIDIPRVGRLSRSNGAALAFSPVADNPIVNMSYQALPTVAVAESVVTPDLNAAILEVDTIGRRSIGSRLRSAARYAAAVAVILAAGAALTTPVIVNRPVDHASLTMPAVSHAKAVEMPAIAPADDADVLYMSIAPEDKLPASVVSPAVVMVSDINSFGQLNDYDCYIIVASCASMSEANRYIAAHGGKDTLRVLPADGRFRVYAAVSNNYDKAYSFKTDNSEFADRYPSAWVYAMK